MMRARTPGLLVPLLLLLLASTAGAHGSWDDVAEIDERSVHVDIVGAPVVAAQTPLRLRADSSFDGEVEARVAAPGAAAQEWFPLGGTREVPLLFPDAGEWTLEVRWADAPDDVARFVVPVWPAADAFVAPASEDAARGVVVAGAPSLVAFELTDASGARIAPPADAMARVESADGEMRTEPLIARDGALVLDRALDEPDELRIEVLSESLGLEAGARPATGLLVVPPEEAGVYGLNEARDTPGLPLAFALLAVVTMARLWRRSCSR